MWGVFGDYPAVERVEVVSATIIHKCYNMARLPDRTVYRVARMCADVRKGRCGDGEGQMVTRYASDALLEVRWEGRKER